MNHRISHNPAFTRLLILRHAQTSLNVQGRIQGNTDARLNQTGIKQAKTLAERLSRLYKIEHIYSSPYPRAVDTAEIVTQKYGLKVEVNNNLMEIGFGEIDNQRFADLETLSPEFFRQTNAIYLKQPGETTGKPIYPGGESAADLKTRVDNFAKHLLDNHRGECVAAVSHGGFIKYMVARFLGVPLEQPFFMSIDNTSISVVDFHKKRVILRTFNDCSHLDKPFAYSRPSVI